MARDPVLRAVRESARETAVPVRLVGGLVRDAALGRAAHDVDLAAGPGCARFVAALAARFGRRPFRFRKRGVITWRIVLDGREVDVVDVGRRGFARDLARRDFTLNAVAFDPLSGLLEDPLRGLADLRRGLLRAPRPATTFRDDPVRALRAARFLAAFPGWRLHRETAAGAAAAARALRRASPERIRDELQALLLARDPRAGLRALLGLGLLPSVLPEMVATVGCAAGPGRPDVFLHTADALGSSPRLPGEDGAVLRWALLLHDVSKPETLELRDDGRPTFHGHEVLGAERAEAVLRRLKHPRARVRRVKRLIALHLRPGHLADAGCPPRGVRRLVADAGEDLPLLLAHAEADVQGTGGPPDRARRARLRRTLSILRAHGARAADLAATPLLGGEDVMRVLQIGPGPAVGRALAELAELRDAGTLRSRDEALAWLDKERRAR
ncbi:MAG TPA: HD domain-containing protein [Candidatus Polarisedimenticolaceae bacterium]|nr:HD domain-containing protein [Candidatus Polarisedimenticolaceae bacterium]